MEKLIQALKSLIIDIEGMRCIPYDSQKDTGHWFGLFSESTHDYGDGSAIEWPNLAISVDGLKTALFEIEATHRHINRGTLYRVLGEAELQTSIRALHLVKGDTLTVYQGEDGKLWIRDTEEFNDGRFEKVL
jgi:hypothetical protein